MATPRDGVMRDDLPPVGSIVKRRLHAGGAAEPVARQLLYHFGVYAGSRRVIHFTGESKKTKGVRVRSTSLLRFLDREPLIVHRVPEDRGHGQAVVATARQFVRKKFRKEYDLLFNNCEDFALHCYTVPTINPDPPRGWRTQVKKVLVAAGVVGASVIVVIFRGVFGGKKGKA